jgi:hypothetical protein
MDGLMSAIVFDHFDEEPHPKIVAVLISQLRIKLSICGLGNIKNQHSVGYAWEPDAKGADVNPALLQVRDLCLKGVPVRQISKIQGVTEAAVRSRMKAVGVLSAPAVRRGRFSKPLEPLEVPSFQDPPEDAPSDVALRRQLDPLRKKRRRSKKTP